MRNNPNELRAERYDILQKAQVLIASAKETGKDLAGANLEQFNAHVAGIKGIDRELDRMEKSHGKAIVRDHTMPGGPTVMDEIPVMPVMGATQPTSEGWTDARTGQPVAVLRPDQKMSALARDYDCEGPLSLGNYLRGIVTGKWTGAEREMKAMTEGTLGSGGYLLPSPLSTQIIDRVRNQAVLLRAGARTVVMDNSTLAMARITGDVTPQWHTESAALTASDMAFDRVTFTAQTLAALCQLSVELFEDASNIDSIVVEAISKVLALELDRVCLRGTGTAPQPKGILNQTGVGLDTTTFGTNGSVINSSSPTGAVAWDWLAKQVSSIWALNEVPNAAIYSARTAGELDLLRATTGAVLPPPGSVGKLNLLFTNSIPNNLTVGSNSDCSECYVGDFNQALIGMRNAIMVEISRYATIGSTSMFSTMQVGIRCYLRSDFQLARPAAFRVVSGIR